jgi:molecular chaperone GrpE
MSQKKLTKSEEDLLQKLGETTEDLQRTRADFENYRKNVEIDKERYGNVVKNTTIEKLLPIIDDIERATSHLPAELADNDWAQGVAKLHEKFLKDLAYIGVAKINAEPGTVFNPEYHEAIQVDDEGGEQETVAEELRAGWLSGGEVIRPAMVRVKRS